MPQIDSYLESSPKNNFMDTKFKSRAPAPSMIVGYINVNDIKKTKKQTEAEESQYIQDMLAN